MGLVKQSPCKVNLLLNILRRRPDGFHELETLMHPIRVFDELSFDRKAQGIELQCSDQSLPTDDRNLVYRAAKLFLDAADVKEGIRVRLEKRIPLAAGLGGGSGNAATTLLALNEVFGRPLASDRLSNLASSLGSDVPFFLQDKPAIATGRGEKIEALDFFPALKGAAFLLVHPGFGISTAWAYQQLHLHPGAVDGKASRAQKLAALLESGSLKSAAPEFYNSLEAPALQKYPLLAIFQDFFRDNEASATLMSGSGSTTFAVTETVAAGEALAEKFHSKFGTTAWTAVVPA